MLAASKRSPYSAALSLPSANAAFSTSTVRSRSAVAARIADCGIATCGTAAGGTAAYGIAGYGIAGGPGTGGRAAPNSCSPHG